MGEKSEKMWSCRTDNRAMHNEAKRDSRFKHYSISRYGDRIQELKQACKRWRDRANWLCVAPYTRSRRDRATKNIRLNCFSLSLSFPCSRVYHFQFSLYRLITAGLTRALTKVDRADHVALLLPFLALANRSPFYWLFFRSCSDYPHDDVRAG